ncbi:Mss4-like protein [Terfezia claveryi]|nr:Mss4-like protein [Terfezia claveryi]
MPPSSNDRDTRGLSDSEKRQVHENRMDRPPYSLADPSKPFNTIYTGACFCERVKFRISREKPLDAKYCHCTGCQVLHGAPFQWAAIFEKSDVNFYEGRDQLIYWNSGEKSTEYILPCKVYCNHCRAPIMDEGRNMLLLFPTLIQFKDAKSKLNFKPSCHIFYSRRAIDVPDGIPKWAEHKDESEQISENFPPHHNEPARGNEEGKL